MLSPRDTDTIAILTNIKSGGAQRRQAAETLLKQAHQASTSNPAYALALIEPLVATPLGDENTQAQTSQTIREMVERIAKKDSNLTINWLWNMSDRPGLRTEKGRMLVDVLVHQLDDPNTDAERVLGQIDQAVQQGFTRGVGSEALGSRVARRVGATHPLMVMELNEKLAGTYPSLAFIKALGRSGDVEKAFTKLQAIADGFDEHAPDAYERCLAVADLANRIAAEKPEWKEAAQLACEFGSTTVENSADVNARIDSLRTKAKDMRAAKGKSWAERASENKNQDQSLGL